MLSSPVEEIKNRLDVVEVVGSYVKLQKAGANYRALCPFHSEKGPSFFVSPARQLWRCFGCGVGGDMFEFIMQIEGVEFRDALQLLADRAGIELAAKSPAFERIKTEKGRLYDMLELAIKFFEKQLSESTSGLEAKKYLKDRGFNSESIEKWRIGYAPDSKRSLLEFLQQNGYTVNEVGKGGLLVHSNGETYDRFRGRIMFPIFDLSSKGIGFGGRIFGKKEKNPPAGGLAKYINTSNTPIYDKSRTLYGLDKAKLAIRKSDSCILVEGYTDTIAVSQAGFENVVATSGTALTESQLRILKRYTEHLLLAFDMDVAGDSATKRGIDLAIVQGFAIKVITMPEGKDPADVVSENAQEWKLLMSEAKSIFDFYFATTFSRFDKNTPEGKKEIARVILPEIKKLPSKIEQAHWVQRLSDEFNVKEEDIYEELAKVKREAPVLERRFSQSENDGKEARALKPKTRKDLLEERTLTLVFCYPDNLRVVNEENSVYFSVNTREIFEGLRKTSIHDTETWKGVFSQNTTKQLELLALRADVEKEEEGDWEKEFRSCIYELQMLHMRARLDAIAKDIRQAEREKNTNKVTSLTEEFHNISRDLS